MAFEEKAQALEAMKLARTAAAEMAKQQAMEMAKAMVPEMTQQRTPPTMATGVALQNAS